MAYTTIAKVQSLFRKLDVDANTAVTTTEVNDMIAEVDAEIDGKLVDHYAVPIVDASSLLIVGKISRMKVAHLIKTILESTNQLSDREQEVQTNLEKKADALLLSIIPTYNSQNDTWVDPILQLTGASAKSKTPKTGNLFQSNTREITVKRGGLNW